MGRHSSYDYYDEDEFIQAEIDRDHGNVSPKQVISGPRPKKVQEKFYGQPAAQSASFQFQAQPQLGFFAYNPQFSAAPVQLSRFDKLMLRVEEKVHNFIHKR